MSIFSRTLAALAVAGTCSYLYAIEPPPATRVEPVDESPFGKPIRDDYRWLENGSSAEVAEWTTAQNVYTETYLKALPNRDAIKARLTELSDVPRVSDAKKRKKRVFFERIEKGRSQPQLCWQDETGGEIRVIVDFNKQSSGTAVALGAWAPSPDGKWLVYAAHPGNDTRGVLTLVSVDQNIEKPQEQIPWADYADMAWDPSSEGFFYSRVPTNPLIPETEVVAFMDVAYHALGKSPLSDARIYPPSGDSSIYLSPAVSSDDKWLLIVAQRGWASTAIYFRELQKKTEFFQILFTSTQATASADAWGSTFYLLTNENAPFAKILKTDYVKKRPLTWTTLIAEEKNKTLEKFAVTNERLVIEGTKDVSSFIEARRLDGGLERVEPLPFTGTVSEWDANAGGGAMFFNFQSFFSPEQSYQLDLASGTAQIWVAVSSGTAALDGFATELTWAPSKDGTPISMFVLNAATPVVARPQPTLLTAYGGFGIALSPHYSPLFRLLLEHGWTVALPHLRGGGEYGETWHREGMLEKKQNTFDDMIAAATFLTEKNFTRPDLLAIQGSSNGGLTAAAAMTQRPDLFHAAVLRGAITDMLRFPLSGEGPTWVPEFGSPDDADQFKVLLSYSPYHRVKEKTAYPAVLITCSANDHRVDPMHARKMTAALQAASSSNRPVLFLSRINTGHGFGSNQDRTEELTDVAVFLENQIPTESQ